MYGDYEIFWGGLLGGSYAQAELYLELREYSDLTLFCLNGLLSCPDNLHSISERQSISEKVRKNLKVRFPHSKIAKI